MAVSIILVTKTFFFIISIAAIIGFLVNETSRTKKILK